MYIYIYTIVVFVARALVYTRDVLRSEWIVVYVFDETVNDDCDMVVAAVGRVAVYHNETFLVSFQ